MLRPVELVRGGIAFGDGKFSDTITADSQYYFKDTRHALHPLDSPNDLSSERIDTSSTRRLTYRDMGCQRDKPRAWNMNQ